MKRLLFLCSRNQLRSPTAEEVFADHPGVEVDSAGTASDAEIPVTSEHLEWADQIVVMESVHRKRLNERFKSSLKGKRITVLGIPDQYEFMDERLVEILKRKASIFLP